MGKIELLGKKNQTEYAITLMEINRNFRVLENTIRYFPAKNKRCKLIPSNDEGFFTPPTLKS